MPIELYAKEDFTTVATHAPKPAAFLVGSPLSKDANGGVPDVNQILDFIADKIRNKAPLALERYTDTIRSKTGVEAYQSAMRWLRANLTQDAINKVVAKAVCQARKPGAPTKFEGDGAHSDWYLPQGTRQLAELVTRKPEEFPGPIVTTNFDPLLSLAIDAAGGRSQRRIIDTDGNLPRQAESQPGIIDIVHLHGYWWQANSLHTHAQLTAPRPKLKASLQNLLRQRTLIVVAYSGWDDVFTNALAELLNDDEAMLNVLWCFYETDANVIEGKYKSLFDKVTPAIINGRFNCYGGIDCHSIFGEISGNPTRSMPEPEQVLLESPLLGWQCITSSYLATLKPLEPGELVRYFDGAIPNWRHAISSDIPRRHAVTEIVTRLTDHKHDACSIQLIRAASGEGKSTVLLQSAVGLIRTGNWQVLWRPSPRIGLKPQDIEKLDSAQQWLIVADDADNLVTDLAQAAELISQPGRTNIHFLLAAHDIDWHAQGGDQVSWGKWLEDFRAIVLRGITSAEAKDFVAAWSKYGPNGLRALATKKAKDRKEILFNAVQNAIGQPNDGSLFGGLLAVRFGPAGLQAHVRSFLKGLKDIPIENSRYTLFDALLYVAACHGAGIPGINEKVLADLLNVPREWIQTRVVRQLGEEATATQNAGNVFARHSQVAAAILVEVDQSFQKDLGEIWAQIVRKTVKAKDAVPHQFFITIVHAATKLQQDLPQQLAEERRRSIAIATALADVDAEKNRLVPITNLGKTYRNAKFFDAAIKTFREYLPSVEGKVDYEEGIRSFWNEWGICEGRQETKREYVLADIWLCGLSLSDFLKTADRQKSVPITIDNIHLICNGLGVAFGRLAETREEFAKARRAATYIGQKFKDYDPRAEDFEKYDRQADNLKTPHPKNNDEAIAWLTAGVIQAGRELKDPFLVSLIKPEQVSFHQLHSVVRKSQT